MYISFVIRDSKVCSEPSLSANCIDQTDLELSDPATSTSQVLELQSLGAFSHSN